MDLIDVIVLFENKQAAPVKFRHRGIVYDVQKVVEQKAGKALWAHNPNQIYTVLTKDGREAELEWIVDTGEWLLNHIK